MKFVQQFVQPMQFEFDRPQLVALASISSVTECKEPTSGKTNDLYVSILLFAAALLVYNINFRENSQKDTIATRFLPISIIEEFDLDLDEYYFLRKGDTDSSYHLQRYDFRITWPALCQNFSPGKSCGEH